MAERALGTMIAYGFPDLSLESELDLAASIGAEVLEILPHWASLPDPLLVRSAARDRGLRIHSAHGCWGGQSIRADRVDLGHPEPATFQASLDDLRRCLDWLREGEGTFLVVHPGGLSTPSDQAARAETLARGLTALAEHVRGSGLVICVENMPPGVYPGSRMADLRDLLVALDLPELGLALDTGHAHISSELAAETLVAGNLLRTTHVHDNDGRRDTHDAPGRGGIDWPAWAEALDRIDFAGPVMLECVRQLRSNPSLFDAPLIRGLLPRRSARGRSGRDRRGCAGSGPGIDGDGGSGDEDATGAMPIGQRDREVPPRSGRGPEAAQGMQRPDGLAGG